MSTDPSIRRRQPPPTTSSSAKSPTTPTSSTPKKPTTNSPFYYLLEAARTLAGLSLLAILSSYLLTSGRSYSYGLLSPSSHPSVLPIWAQPSTFKRYFSTPLVLTLSEIAKHDGSTPGLPIYVGLNGSVYDVSKSPHIYGPGGMYGFLSGKDASRSFITGCFEPNVDLVPYLEGVEEIYVPLWLSRRSDSSTEAEWEEVSAATGATAGRSPGVLIADVAKRLGEEKVEIMRKEAYAAGRAKVESTLETWRKMLRSKGYPEIGKLNQASLDNDPLQTKAKDLPLCKEALKNRPSMTESLTAAMAAMVKDGKLDIGKMAKDYAAKAGAKAGSNEGMLGSDGKAREKIKEAMQKGHAAANPHGHNPHAHGGADSHAEARPHAGSRYGEGVPAGVNSHAQSPHAGGNPRAGPNPHAANPHAHAKAGKVAKHAEADDAAGTVGGVPPHGGNKARD